MSDGDLSSVRLDQYCPHPPAIVWRALTDPELVVQWLMPGDFQPKIGHRVQLHAKSIAQTNFSGTIACEVLELVPERRLAFSWADAVQSNPLASVVTSTLRRGRSWYATLPGTLGFRADRPAPAVRSQMMEVGWRTQVLGRLERCLETLARAAVPDDVAAADPPSSSSRAGRR